MKRFLSILLICLMVFVPAFAAEDAVEPADSSWSQINRSVGKDENWVKLNTDGRFHLGEKQPMEGFDGLYIGSWGTFPSMDGSTVCVPMGMELARQWLELDEGDLNGFINFSTTPYAYDRLIQGKANPTVTVKSQSAMMDDQHPIDLVLATYPNADERQAAADAGVELVYVPFCCDAFVFMVNEVNPVKSLTAKQIQEIYTGQHPTWATLGGNPQEMYAYQRPHGSGSQTAMEEMVMQGLKIKEAEENFVSDGMSDAVRQIGNYDNGPGAIGYSYLYYVNTLVENSGIRVLAIDGIAPTEENLQSGAYPYTVNYYAVYRKGDENTEAFVNWLIGEEGQKAVRQAGYIPLRTQPADAAEASEETEKSLTRQGILIELGKLFVNGTEELSVISDDDLIALGKLLFCDGMQEELPNMSHEACVSALRELGIEIPDQAVQ